jgi:DNA-binding LytR/AlgR family response regulator
MEERLIGWAFLRGHRQLLADLTCAAELRASSNAPAVMRSDNGAEVPVSQRQVAVARDR